jgi:Uma2 family endonuclease
MALVAVPGYGAVEIPVWVVDLPSFLRWVHSGELPEKPAVHFINGQVWVDFHMEELNSHNQVKFAFHRLLGELVVAEDLGEYFPDGMRLTNDDAGFSCEPDAMFASHATLEAGRLTFRAGPTTGANATEAVGTPDVVIEIVSPSSEDKDTEWLFPNYWNAGIPEYWLIDCRGTDTLFDIYRHTPRGYVAARRTGGWVRSAVLGRAFRLTRLQPRSGIARYQLETR